MIGMKPVCFLLCFSFITSSNQGKPTFKESKIYGGVVRRIFKRPYLASLEVGIDNFCAACQIAAKWLATTVRCFFNMTKDKVMVRVGSSYRLRGGYLHSIEKLIPHPNFSHITLANNLLLIKLKYGIKPTINKHPIDILDPSKNFQPGAYMSISGWGYLNEEEIEPDILQSQIVKIISESECIRAYRDVDKSQKVKLNAGEFCASTKVAATCLGDAGGPGVINDHLVGILSRVSSKCKKFSLPSIFLRMTDFYYWIASTISDGN